MGEVDVSPLAPYTRLLLDSSPNPDRGLEGDQSSLFDEVGDLGEPPSLIEPPQGCRFNPRCPFVMEICTTEKPQQTEITPGHWSRCHLHAAGRADELRAEDIQFGIPAEQVEVELAAVVETPGLERERADTVVAEAESTSQSGGPQP